MPNDMGPFESFLIVLTGAFVVLLCIFCFCDMVKDFVKGFGLWEPY